MCVCIYTLPSRIEWSLFTSALPYPYSSVDGPSHVWFIKVLVEASQVQWLLSLPLESCKRVGNAGVLRGSRQTWDVKRSRRMWKIYPRMKRNAEKTRGKSIDRITLAVLLMLVISWTSMADGCYCCLEGWRRWWKLFYRYLRSLALKLRDQGQEYNKYKGKRAIFNKRRRQEQKEAKGKSVKRPHTSNSEKSADGCNASSDWKSTAVIIPIYWKSRLEVWGGNA